MALWDRLTERGHVEDRRGQSGPLARLSLGGIALITVATLLSGGNAGDVLINILSNVPEPAVQTDPSAFQGEDSYEVFASTIVGSNNAHWVQTFRQMGREYTEPRLVLFRAATESSCGYARSEVGPHYCPADNTIYLDETFFDELTSRLGAQGGDVAEAYVIAHEVGHHVQNITGQLGSGTSQEDSIRTELQADCYAGTWASSIRDRDVFQEGEIREAMDAAAAVGDDRIQEKVTGYINPETWTHGSSSDRVSAFTRGYESGDANACRF